MNPTLLTLIIYLALMFGVAWWFSRKESLEAYFLNARSTKFWMMTFSTVATVVGGGATVAVVAEVYNSGISYGIALPISFIVGMLILALVSKKIKEIGDKYDAYTIVDFFQKRFDSKNRVLAGILQLFLLIVWTGVQALAITSLASVLIGIEFQIALLLAAAVTIAYTAIGGLKIDIITDFVQFWIILLTFIVMAVFGYIHVGGISNLFSQLPAEHLNPFAFGGISWFIGVMLISGFLYLGNTAHWQRIFSAKDASTAKKSFFMSIPITALLGILILFLGLVSVVVLQGVPKNMAIFALMDSILPSYLVGIGFASILAVAMSSIDSLLIGGSTIIYRALKKDEQGITSNKLLSARTITIVFGLLGFLLAFLIPDIAILSLLVSYLALIFIPPIISGIYSQKLSPKASFYSLLLPTIVLFALFPFLKENVFIVTTPFGIFIVLFFDKIFKTKKFATN